MVEQAPFFLEAACYQITSPQKTISRLANKLARLKMKKWGC